MNISIENFQTDLIEASMSQAVLLDIWAPWCGPCKALGPVLEALEVSYAGRFKLAKLNADEQPDISNQLSQMFGVRSIPFCVLFKDGQPVDGFVGALPETKIKEFLDQHLPTPQTLAAQEQAEQAGQLLVQKLSAQGEPGNALEQLQAALDNDPANDSIRADCVQALLITGQIAQARTLFTPVASKVLLDARLSAIEHWLIACEHSTDRCAEPLHQAIEQDRRNFAARFELAQIHMAARQWTQAMETLLEIILRDKTWQNDSARKTYVAILELMRPLAPKHKKSPDVAPKSTLEIAGVSTAIAPADPVIEQYRRKLSMALF
jgi:putative thioredoxin